MISATNTTDSFEQNIEVLRKDLKEDSLWSKLLDFIESNKAYYAQKVIEVSEIFISIKKLNNISTRLSNISTANDIKYKQESIREILKTLKDKYSWAEFCNQPIKQVIDSVEDLPEESVNDMIKTIGTEVDKYKVNIADNYLIKASAVLAFKTLVNIYHVIKLYDELKTASNLAETSKEQLECIAKYVNEVQEQLTIAKDFLKNNQLNKANKYLIRAGEKAHRAYINMEGIKIQCNNQILTLKTTGEVTVQTGMSTFLDSIFNFATIAVLPSSSKVTKLSWIVAGTSILIGGGSIIYSHYITKKRINELQHIMDEIREKKTELDKIQAEIDELNELVESRIN